MTYPTISPELTLDFAKSEQLDPRITFSRSSSATYVGSDGLIKTAPDGVARFEYDSDGKCLGLLVEEARTNVVPYSETFQDNGDDTGWRTANGTVTPSAGTAPDGGSASSVEGYIYKRLNWGPAGTSNSTSVYVKAGTATTGYITGLNGNVGGIDFDLSVGTVSDDYTNDSTFIESVGNGWFRIGFSRTSTANLTAINLRIGVTGSGTILFWGVQTEMNTFPTSYIATTSSTVTRAADLVSITGTNFSSWYNGSEGTFTAIADHSQFANYQLTVEGADATVFKDFSMGMSDTNVQFFSSRYSFAANNVFGSNAISSGVVFKQAGGYSSAGTAAAFDGSLGTVSSSSAAEGATRMGIGSRLAGLPAGLFLNGHIARLSYYPERVSDESLEALTA